MTLFSCAVKVTFLSSLYKETEKFLEQIFFFEGGGRGGGVEDK